jgi:3-oxoacyl-[acyl-carrier protein] reductase
MSDILRDKVAVVTGSGQGIGRAIAVAMAKEGAKVVTNNRKPGGTKFAVLSDAQLDALTKEKKEHVLKLAEEYSGDAETTAQKIRELGGEAIPFFGDVSNFEVAGKLIQKAVDSFGKIDILANIAGAFRFSAIWEMTEETWDYVNNIKPKGCFNCIRHAAPFMMEQKQGRILNCTSQAWAGDVLKHAEYAAANAGVVGLTRAAASELYPYGITCNAFAPFAKTRAAFELEAYDLAVKGESSPYMVDSKLSLETVPSPDDIAPFLVYLASDAAAEVSGTVFGIGGSTVGIYADPDITKSITKDEGTWTMEELIQQVPRLLEGYKARVASLITFKDAGRA